MLERTNYTFWDRYFKADELERWNIIKELPFFTHKGKQLDIVKVLLTPTILQGYFDDLIEYMKTQKVK